MKIYTKTGDDGGTALYRGGRISKSSIRINAYGTVDELNSQLGWCRTQSLPIIVDSEIELVQNNLFVIGADLATPESAVKPGDKVIRLHKGTEKHLENSIDSMEASLAKLKQFILPGGCVAASALHIARSVCRRAEREVIKLSVDETVNPFIIIYLNRLSDYLFVAARYLNYCNKIPDTIWSK